MARYRLKFDSEVELIPIEETAVVAPSPRVPLVDQWAANMLTHARKHAALMTDPASTFDAKLAACLNYDGFRVFQQVKEHTKSNEFDGAIAACRAVYRDQYLFKCNFAVPGYYNYTGGLTEDALAGDARSREAVLGVATKAPYCLDSTAIAATTHCDASREVAYAIMAMLNAERLGAARRPRLQQLITHAVEHVKQWFERRSAPYVRPFMVSLTCYALIRCIEANVPFDNLEKMLQLAADETWKLYLPDKKTFPYTDRVVENATDTNPAPDLNLLIAPVYAWLYQRTGSTEARTRADLLWEGGIPGADLNAPKRFNQNYLHSFNFLKWRNARK